MRTIKAIPILALALVISGCTPTERLAYNTVVGAKASLVSFRAKHPECSFDAVTGLSQNVKVPVCTVNNRLTAAKDAIIDAAEVYCSGPDFENGGACNPPKKGTPGFAQAQAKLQSAIASYKQIEKDVSTVLKGGL